MGDIRLALLGSQGAGKSALVVRFLTKRFIGEYVSDTNFLYHKRFSVDGRQLNLEVFDPCSQSVGNRSILEEPLEWADAFIVVYDITDHMSFLNAKSVPRRIREARVADCKGEVPVCLVGNKLDLCHARQVAPEEGRLLALEHRGRFWEVSAAEEQQEIFSLVTPLMRDAAELPKCRADRHRGSKSMAQFLNNVFCKRRKSV